MNNDDYSLSDDEMLVTAEEFSLMCIEVGLRNADILPLAEHLRDGFALSPGVAGMIADCIDGKAGSACKIGAVRLNDGRPREGNANGRSLDIGIAYLKRLQTAKRGHSSRIKKEIADKFGVSEATLRDAVAYTRKCVNSWSEK